MKAREYEATYHYALAVVDAIKHARRFVPAPLQEERVTHWIARLAEEMVRLHDRVAYLNERISTLQRQLMTAEGAP